MSKRGPEHDRVSQRVRGAIAHAFGPGEIGKAASAIARMCREQLGEPADSEAHKRLQNRYRNRMWRILVEGRGTWTPDLLAAIATVTGREVAVEPIPEESITAGDFDALFDAIRGELVRSDSRETAAVRILSLVLRSDAWERAGQRKARRRTRDAETRTTMSRGGRRTRT